MSACGLGPGSCAGIVEACNPIFTGIGCNDFEVVGRARFQARNQFSFAAPVVCAVSVGLRVGASGGAVLNVSYRGDGGCPTNGTAACSGLDGYVGEPGLGTRGQAEK